MTISTLGRRVAVAMGAGLLTLTSAVTPAAAEPVPVPTNRCTAGFLCLYREAYFSPRGEGGDAINSVGSAGCHFILNPHHINSIINRTNSDWAVFTGDRYCPEENRIAVIYARTANNQISSTVASQITAVMKLN